jgi:LysM repeat protein
MEDLGSEAAARSATMTAEAMFPSPTPPFTAAPTVDLLLSPTAAPETPTALPTQAPPTAQPTPDLTQPALLPTQAATPTATTAGSSAETTYVVQPGDNLYRIALRFGLRYEDLAVYNHIVDPTRIQPGQVIRIPGGSTPGTPPAQGETLYTIQRGDNLFRIALRYGLNYVYLASYNGITNPNRIAVGQVIRIPPAP